MAAKKAAASSDVEPGSRTLEPGIDPGGDIEMVQALVLTPVTGEYDPTTVKAVKVWQKHRGLTPTGIVGPNDWKRVLIDTGSTGA